ncbi:hypothetical protein GCM10007901_04560 [Dyella acidisoli]|uniref:Uncharacterized protein n=2 Tax=Dyella acidisoli TaxID=1867834 RepID=A0ABQ5XLQ8_9GAMM|nr:hypothetical protein GCM10007901_04560 [Dyella acidisoli]
MGSSGAGELIAPMYQGHIVNVHRRVKKNDYARVSTLEFICLDIAKKCIAAGIIKPIIIRGINGVGYIGKGKGGVLEVEAIDYRNYNLVQRLNAAKSLPATVGALKKKEAIAKCEKAIEDEIAKRTSPHIIGFQLNIDAYFFNKRKNLGTVVIEDELEE